METTLNDYIQRIRGSRQDDGDADGVDGEQEQVYNGVRRLLQNVFSGNLIGVIQEGVGIRGPGRVQEFFSGTIDTSHEFKLYRILEFFILDFSI